MSRFCSIGLICAAFNTLASSSISQSNLSALRYFFALDSFKKDKGRNCDLRSSPSSDKDDFCTRVASVVAIDAESHAYIDTFGKGKPTKSKLSDQINSNFISANAVRQSRGKHGDNAEKYPSRGNKPLFRISDEVLEVDTMNYGHLDSYLPTREARFAFALWAVRYEELGEDSSGLSDVIKAAFGKKYTDELVDALWKGDGFDFADLGFDDLDGAFSEDRPLISRQLLWQCPMLKSSASGPYNLIRFGAPGTGKSYTLDRDAHEMFPHENIKRVTFHPDYTYAQFVGCFKPVSVLGGGSDLSAADAANAPSRIEYRFIPGPFVLTYVEAVKHPEQNYLLLVEEINRAKPAAVFGDVFQLLDRKEDGASEYPVSVSEDLHSYLKVQLGPYLTDEAGRPFGSDQRNPAMIRATSRIALPPNMYIWATMNSADQGVYPMDTAFKRRWDFEYMDINAPDSVAEIERYQVPVGNTGQRAKWNDLRILINNVLRRARINEDKWLGPFFVKPSSLADDEAFLKAFQGKVLLYLYEDVAKTKRGSIFSDPALTYPELCDAFLSSGIDVFHEPDHLRIVSIDEGGEIVGEAEDR